MILASVVVLFLSGSAHADIKSNTTYEYEGRDLSALFSTEADQEQLLTGLNDSEDDDQLEFTASELPAVPSTPQENFPTAVLGRGIQNRKTETTLILGCTAAPLVNSAGKTICEEVQFFQITKDGVSSPVGRPMKIGIDIDSKKGFSALFKDRIKAMKKNGQIKKGVGLMPMTRGWYGNPTISSSTKLLTGAVNIGVPLMLLSGGAPILGAIACGLFFPVGIDLALTPFVLVANAFQGNFFIKSKIMDVAYKLEDRRPDNWQFRPKRVAPKAYERFFLVASSTPKRVIRVARTLARTMGGGPNSYCDVQHNDGQYERIAPCENIIIYSKNAGREEF